ncbi:hypothetical protein NKH93_32435 [Mesorhizobium sp. M0954]
MRRVYFGLSGSAANETNIKLVWYYNNILGRPEKNKIISRHRGYHGSGGLVTGSLTGLPFFHKFFYLPLNLVRLTTTPHYYRQSHEGETEEAFSKRCADELETLILAEGLDTVLKERNILEHVRDVGPYWLSRNESRIGGHPILGEVRGVGILSAVELMRDPKARVPFEPELQMGARAAAALLENGVIGRAMPHGDILGFAPPLIITRDELTSSSTPSRNRLTRRSAR